MSVAMHAVQPPQHRHRMEQDVLQIDGKIEQNHGHERHGDEGNGNHVEQSPAARLAHQRGADGGGREENADQKNIDGENAEIAGPARSPPHGKGALGCQGLPKRHCRDHAGKANEPDQPLVSQPSWGQETFDHRCNMAAPLAFSKHHATAMTAHARHCSRAESTLRRSRDWRVGNFIRRAGLVPGMAVQNLKLRHLVF